MPTRLSCQQFLVFVIIIIKASNQSKQSKKNDLRMTLKTVQEEIEKTLAFNLKTRFLDENETDYKEFDSCDVERLKRKGSDLYFRIFIRARQGDVEKAYDMMVESLKWRKKYKINEIRENGLDREVLETGILYYHKIDKKGHRILIFHGNKYVYKNDRDKAEKLERIFAYYLERQQRELPGKQLLVICDHQDADLSNVDLDFFKFLVNLFSNYYPRILDSFVVLNVSWRLSAVWKVIKSWFSFDMSVRFKFIDRSKLTDFVEKSDILDSMGGEDSYTYTWSPSENDPLDNNDDEESSSNDLGSSQDFKKDNFHDPIESETMPELEEKEDARMQRKEKGENGFGLGGKAAMGGSLGTQLRNRFSGKESSLEEEPPSDSHLEENILIITPSDEIVFREVEHEHEIQKTLLLKNSSENTIIFKIKTNSPANFRVRPSVGGLWPGASKQVTLMLLAKADDSDHEKQEQKSKEKFLILYSEISNEITNATDFSELWQNVPKIDTNEHILNCRILDAYGMEKRPKTIEDVIEITFQLKQQLSHHQTKVNEVSNSLSEIKNNLQQQNVMLIIMLAVTLLACLVFWFR